MAWEFSNKSSIFLQIVDKIKADIVSGKYPAGSQIPPVRQLAQEAAVNPNTMQRALSELESLGFLETRGTVGRFVTTDAGLLNKTNQKAKNDALENLVKTAEELGITGEEIISFIKNRKNEKEDVTND